MGSIKPKRPATRAMVRPETMHLEAKRPETMRPETMLQETMLQETIRANRAAMVMGLTALLIMVASLPGCGKKSNVNGSDSPVSQQNSRNGGDPSNGQTNRRDENRPRLPDVEPTGNTQTIDQMEVDELVQALGHSDLTKRLDAAAVLAEQGQEVVPDLIKALDAENYHVRAGAVFALGKLGPIATSALDRLREIAADDEREVVRDAALFAIDAIEGG